RENPPLLPLSQHVAGTHSQMLDQDTKAAEHWLPTLQELAGRTSHEIKNALNGVAVNLEVLRSRLERGAGEGDAVAASVAPFARSASEQLDVLAELTEALLALARPAQGSGTQLRGIVRRAVRLADAMVRTDGRGVVLVTGDDDALTSVPGDVARWIVVRLLLDGLAEGHALVVSLESGPGTEAGPQFEAGSQLHIRTAQGAP